jgi:HAE1 family hydrophobic/amphiphilic exporter-1
MEPGAAGDGAPPPFAGHWLWTVIRRPVAVTMFVISLAVFGAVSFSKLKVDLLPEISYPTLTVRTTWPGAAPEDVEERLSEKLQEALSTLDDLVRSTSISRAGTSDVLLEFDWGTSMTFAVEDVRERLGGVFLPDGAERPLILRYDPNLDPILRIGVRAPAGREAQTEEEREAELIQLRWIAENRLKRELESLEGVAVAQVRGGLEEEIRVHVDPERLSALKVDPGDLARRLAQENINASGGSLTEGSVEYLVRTVNQFRGVDEIEAMPVVRRGDAIVRVRDLGHVERSYEKREVVTRIGGGESVELALFREADANIVHLAKNLRERVFGTEAEQKAALELAGKDQHTLGERQSASYLAHELRKEVQLELLSDQSVFIEDAVEDVQSSAVIGSLLAVLVIWLFLRSAAGTFVIGVSIPISLVVAFAPMFLADVTLNIMSMGGLALGTGMMLDNAIVILESITSRREQGDDRRQAAVRGTAEVTGAMIASTLTSVAVFAPIVFVTGIAGQIFGDQALTVVSFQFISLLMAVLLIPIMTARMPFGLAGGMMFGLGGVVMGSLVSEALEANERQPPTRPPKLTEGLSLRSLEGLLTLAGRSLLVPLGLLARLLAGFCRHLGQSMGFLTRPVSFFFGRAWGLVERIYPRFLELALANPLVVLAASLALFWAALARIPALGVELLPRVHQGEFTAHVRLAEGTPLATTDEALHELDAAVRALPGVATTALTVGVEKETLSRQVEGSHTARLTVRLDQSVRTGKQEDELEDDVRRLLESHPAVRSIEFSRPTPFALESPLAVEVRGYDLGKLQAVAAEVVTALEGVSGLTGVHSSVKPGNLEAKVTFDREKMLELGLDLAAVTTLVRDQLQGNVSTNYHEGDERIGIRVQGDPRLLDSLNAVSALPVNPSAETPVPLRSVAWIDEVQGPSEIRRIGNTRAVVVTGESTGFDLGGLTERIQRRLAQLSVPEDVTVEIGGQKREMDEALASMRFAFFLAIFLVYVVMACQFESIVQPLIILVTVPLGIVGVVFVLDLLGVSLSVVVFLGLILLGGIVVNNAIVLIDRINQMRAAGMDALAAVREAGVSRLRPILMTTVASVFGLLPMTGWLGWVPVIGKLGSGAGAELRAPMAVTVIAGLTSATLLTLIVIPSIYALIARHARPRSAT